MKNFYAFIFLIFSLLISCNNENLNETDYDIISKIEAKASSNDCNLITYTAINFNYNGGAVQRINQYGNTYFPFCTIVNAYVTSNTIVNYERVVQVYYNYEHKAPDLEGKSGIIAVEQFTIPANSNKSSTRTILNNTNNTTSFEADGKVKSVINNVSYKGITRTCFDGRGGEMRYVNCYTKPRKTPKLEDGRLNH